MTTPVPDQPKIYHITHLDRLPSITEDGKLWCDAVMASRQNKGTVIGLSEIKQRRLSNFLTSHADLRLKVGDCVPFYFCPRSVMLFVIHKKDHRELGYAGGQEPIVHLEADFHLVVKWAKERKRRWAFTTSNAGSYLFEDYSDLEQLNKIAWGAVQAEWWENTPEFPDRKENKQAEFLLQGYLPWTLIDRVGVYSHQVREQVLSTLITVEHRPPVEVKKDWYY